MDRQDWLLVSLWVHVPFITLWIGLVMLDGFAVFAPGVEDGQRARMLRWSRTFVLVAIPVIMVTGIYQTMENPFFRVESYSGLKTLRARTLYGDLLFWKHVFVIATFALTVFVRFYLAPKLATVADSAPRTVGFTVLDPGKFNLARLATAANLAACLGAILFATRMVGELH